MFAEIWYQNPIVVVAGFAFVTAGLTRMAKVKDDKKVRTEKLADEQARLLEKAEDEQRRIDKENRDNARSDEVAARVAEAAELAAGAAEAVKAVAVTAAEAAALLVESNHRSQARDTAFTEKLDKIGLSADGTLTAALKAQLLALRNLMISEQKVVDDRVTRGGKATKETENMLVATHAQIEALTEEIKDREVAGLTANGHDQPIHIESATIQAGAVTVTSAFTPPHGIPLIISKEAPEETLKVGPILEEKEGDSK